MAELVDALASGASVRMDVEVRVLFWAPGFYPLKTIAYIIYRLLVCFLASIEKWANYGYATYDTDCQISSFSWFQRGNSDPQVYIF